MTEQQQSKLLSLLRRYAKVFAISDDDLGETSYVEHRIETGDAFPVKKKMYRTPVALREEIQKQVDKLLHLGIVDVSTSPWAAPIVMVKKHDGSWRMCVDFRGLNAVTKKFAMPLPNITEILDSVGSARVFSSLDMRMGYHQIPIRKQDQEKTAFTCQAGLFEFK